MSSYPRAPRLTDGPDRYPMHRLAPGEYAIEYGTFTVMISRYYWLDRRYGQWVARADWDQHLYTDPMMTLRDARDAADAMIDEAVDEWNRSAS